VFWIVGDTTGQAELICKAPAMARPVRHTPHKHVVTLLYIGALSSDTLTEYSVHIGTASQKHLPQLESTEMQGRSGVLVALVSTSPIDTVA
jgi:hypothetical protein